MKNFNSKNMHEIIEQQQKAQYKLKASTNRKYIINGRKKIYTYHIDWKS